MLNHMPSHFFLTSGKRGIRISLEKLKFNISSLFLGVPWTWMGNGPWSGACQTMQEPPIFRLLGEEFILFNIIDGDGKISITYHYRINVAHNLLSPNQQLDINKIWQF